MNIRHRALTVTLIAFGLWAIAIPALAGTFGGRLGQVPPPLENGPFVVITGELRLPEGSTTDAAVIFNGPARIDGVVSGDVIAVNGDVVVSGTVREDVVSLNGRVTVTEGARVDGDVVSRSRPMVDGSATIGGQIRRVSRLNNLREFTIVGRILVWLATSVSSFLLGLLLILFVPRAVDATARTGIDRLGASIGFGLLALIGVPLVAFIAIGILVGIPFGIGVLFALGLIYWLGYTAGAFMLGRRLVAAPTNRVLAFLVGWGILRLLALIPVAGFFIWVAATVWGLGALVLAARTAGRETPDAPGAGVPVAGTPPVPPMPPMVPG